MIVLDTNVVSEMMRPRPSPVVVEWLDTQPADEVAVTAITTAEIFHGIRRLPEGSRKSALEAAAVAMFDEEFAERVLPFDQPAARHYADIVVQRERLGRPISMADAQIAALARHHAAVLATRNVRDFEELGLELIDPWESSQSD